MTNPNSNKRRASSSGTPNSNSKPRNNKKYKRNATPQKTASKLESSGNKTGKLVDVKCYVHNNIVCYICYKKDDGKIVAVFDKHIVDQVKIEQMYNDTYIVIQVRMCDTDGQILPQEEGSEYARCCFLAILPEDIDLTRKFGLKLQSLFIQKWNKLGSNPNICKFRNTIKAGEVFDDTEEPEPLDNTVYKDDVAKVIHLVYGFEFLEDIMEFAEDEEAVSTFFGDYELGKATIINYANEHMKSRHEN